MLEGTTIPPTIGYFRVRLKTPLVVLGTTVGDTDLVLDAYASPRYFVFKRASWVVLCAGKVIEVFEEDVELMTAQRIPLTEVPDQVLKYIVPDYRGFTTMPYQRE